MKDIAIVLEEAEKDYLPLEQNRRIFNMAKDQY
jgi:hypothetical protein